jgi:hypothetical protein
MMDWDMGLMMVLGSVHAGEMEIDTGGFGIL